MNEKKDSLFGRIGELIFSTTIISFLNALVFPQIGDIRHIGLFKRGNIFIVNCSYYICFVLNKI